MTTGRGPCLGRSREPSLPEASVILAGELAPEYVPCMPLPSSAEPLRLVGCSRSLDWLPALSGCKSPGEALRLLPTDRLPLLLFGWAAA